jgi:ABC-2 type transport system ATP-binding protein
MTGAAVQVRGLKHRYGQRVALDGLDLSVARGEVFGVLGPNGSGKSTLFRVLSTLLAPQTGEAHVLGFDLAGADARLRSKLGVVFQSPALDRMLCVSENLRHHGHLYGLSGSTLTARIDAMLNAMGVTDLAPVRVDRLSGGQRRRVELAKAMLHQPDLLLMDEPSTGLDPTARADLWRQLKMLQSQGRTIVLTTHLLDEAAGCDRLAIMDGGRVIACDTPDALQRSQGCMVVEIETTEPPTARARLEAIGGVTARVIDGRVVIDDAAVVSRLVEIIAALGETHRATHIRPPTLLDVFTSLTGRRFD